MTTVGAKPKDYRLLVGIRYLNASDLLLKGMKTLHQDNNPFHFLVGKSHQMQTVWDPLQADSASLIPSIRYVAPSTNWWHESVHGGKTGSFITTQKGSLSPCLPA